MGPNSNTPNFNQVPRQPAGGAELGANQLPRQNVDPSTTANSGYNNLNQAPMRAEQLAAAEALAQPSQAIPAQPVAQPASQQPTPQPAATTAKAKTVDAEDLERIWVEKAQQAIAKDKDDPYELAHQIALLMKGYLQERYGKIIGK